MNILKNREPKHSPRAYNGKERVSVKDFAGYDRASTGDASPSHNIDTMSATDQQPISFNQLLNRDRIETKEKQSRFSRIRKLGRSAIEREAGTSNVKRKLKVGVAALLAVGAAIAGTGVVNAAPHDNDRLTIATSGRGDGNGVGMQKYMPGYLGDNYVINPYSAKIAPLDDERMDSSVQGAVNSGENIIKSSGLADHDLNFVGFSEGSVGTAQLLNNHPEATGVMIGAPGTPDSGLSYSPLAEGLQPVLNAAGINLQDGKVDPNRPGGMTYYKKEQDVWSSQNNGVNIIGNGAQILDTFMGDGHSYTDADLQRQDSVVNVLPNGNTVITIKDNGTNGYGEFAKDNGLAWSQSANELTNVLGGFSPDGQSVQPTNPVEMVNTAVDVINETADFHNVNIDVPYIPAPAPVYEAPAVAPAPVPAMPSFDQLQQQVANDFNAMQNQFNNVIGGLTIPR